MQSWPKVYVILLMELLFLHEPVSDRTQTTAQYVAISYQMKVIAAST